ncbi:kunitz-type serine protease inhibitor Bt-KTI-like [Pollicipes pollicipes]|uniref:kunitz-type serine protease inhibitor Bt-KTI-like n=1 Tax=Pollicipes pollicipes TaxID=41117 RepID=UPI0018856B06|nr:kunitz-type serine protease inhibitor Bt-KTI-like [Pollicipes pollicipes]
MCRAVIFMALVGLAVGYPALNDAFNALIGSSGSACSLPVVRGPCRAYFQRYAFNPSTGTCQPFIFGGCDGNANNFLKRHQCQQACGGY